MTTIRRMWPFLPLLLLLVGCGREVDLGTVTGRVTMQGEPLSGALVQFLPVEGGRSSQGRTDEDGRYTLAYSVHDEGARVGTAKVMITTGNLEDPAHRSETVAFEYNYESTITVDVEPGRNVFDFDVKPREDSHRGSKSSEGP